MQSTRLKKNFLFRLEIALPSAINEDDFLFQGEMCFYLFIQQTFIEHMWQVTVAETRQRNEERHSHCPWGT